MLSLSQKIQGKNLSVRFDRSADLDHHKHRHESADPVKADHAGSAAAFCGDYRIFAADLCFRTVFYPFYKDGGTKK